MGLLAFGLIGGASIARELTVNLYDYVNYVWCCGHLGYTADICREKAWLLCVQLAS